MPSPEHESLVAALLASDSGPPPTDVHAMRAAMASLAGAFASTPTPADVKIDPVDADGVPAFWFVPPDARDDRAILYLHGGGYVMGSVSTHRSLIARLARATGWRCLALDYRLAPEHPFPAAIDDVMAAHRWLQRRGIPPARIVFAGDSAGGGLVLGSLVALRDAGEALPAAAIALSPLADLELTGDSVARVTDDPLVPVDGTRLMAAAYLGAGADPRDPRASPIHADYRGLPPLLLEVGTREVLLDDARRVADRARAAGIPVELFVGEGLTHVWPLHPQLPEAAESIERMARFVARHVG
ncbi:MAG: alpha/beta hydrolase [Myxococcota bacterium]